MGRLGAGEMSYNSDLDLIFVYESTDPMSGREIAARVAQKLIGILEARTREGYAYKLDLRLRPSGNQGPLVTSLEGFREYHRQSSAVWERQALVRARVVAGAAELGEAVEAAREGFVFGRGLSIVEIKEIAQMRKRMELEIGVEGKTRLNLKQGRGGLVDVEFVAQMMALAHGHQHPALRKRATRDLLKEMEWDCTSSPRGSGGAARRIRIHRAAGESASHRKRSARLGAADRSRCAAARSRAGWDIEGGAGPRQLVERSSCPARGYPRGLR